MPEPRLTTPWMRVVMDDGTEHRVRALNVDMVAFDRERGRHREWPSMEDGPMYYQTYIAWHALTRLNKIPKINFNEFCDRAWEISKGDDEDEDQGEDETVDPTRRAAEPA